jgi:methyl-accepting chemotaxis protein
MKVLNRLKLWQKLATLVLLVALPATIVGFLYLQRVNADVAQARDSLDGIEYSQALGVVLSETASHSSKAREAIRARSPASTKSLAESDKSVAKAVADVDSIDAAGGQRFRVSDQWQAIKSEWVDLVTNQARFGADELSARHDKLLSDIMRHIERVALRSGLTRDPDISTFAAIRAAVDEVPHAILAFRLARRTAADATAAGALSVADRTRVEAYESETERHIARAREAVEETTDETSARVQPAVESAEAALVTFGAFVKVKVLDPEKIEITTADLYAAVRPSTLTLAEASKVAYAAATASLEKRLTGTVAHRRTIIGTITLFMALALVIGWLVTRSVTRPMAQAISAFHSIAAGMYDNRMERAGTDEAGQLLQGLHELQQKLRSQAAGGMTQAASEQRVKSALDKVASRVVLADEEFKIIYANEATQKFLFETRADFRRDMPRLDAGNIVGQSVDRLFPAHVNPRRALEQSPDYSTEVRVGARRLRIKASAVSSEQGRRIGTVVELLDALPSNVAAPAKASNA